MFICKGYYTHTPGSHQPIFILFFMGEYSLLKWDGGGMDWIDLAQDRDRWQAHVSTVMNHWVS
jgi:hypothetical protein